MGEARSRLHPGRVANRPPHRTPSPLVGSRRAKLALRVARSAGWGTAVRGTAQTYTEGNPHPTGLRPATLPTRGRDKKEQPRSTVINARHTSAISRRVPELCL